MPDRVETEKYLGLSVNSTTRFAVSGEDHPTTNPLDSNVVYDKYGQQVQSISLDLFQGPDNKFSFSSNIDFLDRFSITRNMDVRIFDTSSSSILWRTQTLNATVRDAGIIRDARLGRQNVFTGFHFFKMDGLSGSIALGDNTTLSGFSGARVDSNGTLVGIQNSTGFIQLQQIIGYRSYADLSFERSMVNNSITANDIGLDIKFWMPGNLVLKGQGLASFGSTVQLSETKLKGEYYLSNQNMPYIGYDYHNPLFADSMTMYYFDVFNYQRAYAGWRLKPLPKEHLYVTGEYDFMLLSNNTVHTAKIALSSTYVDASVSFRFGSVTAASLVSLSGNYPIFKIMSVGAGADYAKLDVYYGQYGASDFFGYYAFANFKPFQSALPLLRVCVQDRTDIFVQHDVRFSIDFNIGYSNRHARTSLRGNQ